MTAPAPDPEARPVHGRPDPAAWDEAVEANPLGSYLQLTAWARVKAVNGWRSRRMLDGEGADAVGAQVLLRRPGPLPWSFAYAPRGPVLGTWDEAALERFTQLARERLKGAGRPSHLRIDPEIERGAGRDEGGRVTEALAAAGWQAGDGDPARLDPRDRPQRGRGRAVGRPAQEVAPVREQGANRRCPDRRRRARAPGRVLRDLPRDGGPGRVPYPRQVGLQRRVAGLRAAGRARLLFAELPDGTPVATLFLVRAGTRVVEPYGGMTPAGADSRAQLPAQVGGDPQLARAGRDVVRPGGLAHAGIAHFKTGFGGREIHYVGAYDLVLDPLGRRTYAVAHAARVRVERMRHGLKGGRRPRGMWGMGAATGAMRDAGPRLAADELDGWDAAAVDAEGGHVLQSRAWGAHREVTRLGGAVPRHG